MPLPQKLTRWRLLRAAAAAAALAAGLAPRRAAAAPRRAPALRSLSVRGSRPFAGDRTLLATVSPGSPDRDRVSLGFTLARPARVTVRAIRTNQRSKLPVWHASANLPRGRHRFLWLPGRNVPAGSYVLRITVESGDERKVYGGGRRPKALDFARAPVVRVLGIEAAFKARSYAPGRLARLRVSADAKLLSVQIFRSGPETANTDRPDELKGVAVAPPRRIPWHSKRDGPTTVTLRLGDWPSGVYFARLLSSDGRRGYAPFVLRPKRLGTSRVAVVMPTNTWQAYNFRDADGDGWGDTWYAGGSPPVRLDRPFLNRGVPPRYRRYDLPFLRWLERTGKRPDFLCDDDLGRFDADALRRTYDLVVFPGHTEYVTQHAYDVIERYRDLGGNLMFLSANNFFWKVTRRGSSIRRVALWRDLGRPEVRVLGSQYRANDDGRRQGVFVVTGADAAPWFFAGTGLRNGSTIGAEVGGYGIEIDATTPESPPATHILATISDLFGAGVTAHMTYYESPAGARVFTAGALDFGGSVTYCPVVPKLLENLWRQLATP